MKERKIEFTYRNIVFYLGGFFFIGLGVNLLLRAELGAGAWDTVTYNLQAVFPSLTLGMCSLLISVTIWIIVMAYRRKAKFLLMIIPLILVSLSIDLWDLVLLSDLMPKNLIEQFIWAILGALFIPFSLSLVIASNFPAFVFDELMLMLKEIFKAKDIIGIRIGIEVFAVVLAIIFWFIADVTMDPSEVSGADIGLGAVSYGTFILAFTIGPLIQFFLSKIKGITNDDTKEHTIYLIVYILGMLAIAFGVVMMIKSNIGLSSWDTLHWSLHKLTGITVGKAVIFVALFFTTFITIVNRRKKYVFMVIPIIVVGILIDILNLDLLVDFNPSTLLIQSAIYFLGLLLLPLGGSLLIISTYPAGVFDEFMITVMRLVKTTKLMRVRVIIEISIVIIALIISLIVADPLEPFGMFKIGTIIFTVSIGFMLKNYLKFFEKIGLYKIKQI
ncbi:MAG: hypothetical protein KQ78_02263 [Candidatus Izimaplasma bacterium HR2]|nr:MAG: hypothetical protein KQ78_02263 [Candidatus Izimaplasma bacterium HR2]